MENTKAKNVIITVLIILLVVVIGFLIFYIIILKNDAKKTQEGYEYVSKELLIVNKERGELEENNNNLIKQIKELISKNEETVKKNTTIIKSKNAKTLNLNGKEHILDYTTDKNKIVSLKFDGKVIGKNVRIKEVKFHKLQGNDLNNNKEYCVVELVQANRTWATYIYYFVSDEGIVLGVLPIDRATGIALKKNNKELATEVKKDSLEYYYPAYENNHNDPDAVGVIKYSVSATEYDITRGIIATLKFKDVEMGGAW